MWQVMLAAAVAGTGYFAKQLLNPNTLQSNHISQQNGQNYNQIEQSQPSDLQEMTQVSDCGNHNGEAEILCFDDDPIFRFSSDSRSRSRFKIPRKKLGSGRKGIRDHLGKAEMKCGLVVDHKKNGRRFGVCLKKRRTGKNSWVKCEFCASKGNSSFGLGVGMGIMYMMSAGKVEISRLNAAVDETAKVVHELKTELAKRKSSRNLNETSSTSRGNGSPRKTQRHVESITEHGDGNEDYFLRVGDEGECGSSVLTEEPELERMEMAQLEAMLESELQKLPGPTFHCDEEISSSFKIDDFSKPNYLNLEFPQKDGVVASELDQKLCHLLIEQQESHIVDLETKLQRTNSKLCEKEAELQALKDCVKRLTEFSIANASDEEIEAQNEEEKTSEVARDEMDCDSRKSAIGIKRAMDFEPYGCCTYQD